MHVAEKCSENEAALTSSVETEFATPTKTHAFDVCSNSSKSRVRYTTGCDCYIPRADCHLPARFKCCYIVCCRKQSTLGAGLRTTLRKVQADRRPSKPSTIPTFFLDTDRYHHSNTALSSISLEYRLSNQDTSPSLPLLSSTKHQSLIASTSNNHGFQDSQ